MPKYYNHIQQHNHLSSQAISRAMEAEPTINGTFDASARYDVYQMCMLRVGIVAGIGHCEPGLAMEMLEKLGMAT